MLKRILPILLAATVLLTACGPKAVPTMSAADVQGTAVSAAWTMVAATQQAIPTATAIPPTETPSPTPLATFTQPPLPTSNLPTPLPVTPTQSTSGDPCNAPVAGDAAGPKVNIRIVNKSKGSMNVSLGLAKTEFGECGYYGFSIAKGSAITPDVLAGCYFVYAWVTEPKQSNSFGKDIGCIKGEDKITIEISGDNMKVIYP